MTDHVAAVAPDRIITLKGGQNFREIGGYPTADGQRLRRGQLWRSAKLDELTSEDVEVIRTLGIATIADLRRGSERRQSPTHEAIMTSTRVLAWDLPEGGGRPPESMFHRGGSPDEYIDAVLQLYRLIAEDHVEHLRDLYQTIADGGSPVLIHCAAGKDRTGVAVGLLLEILGIDRRYIMADYAKTQDLLDWERLKHSAAAGTGVSASWLERLDPVALEILSRADRRYLSATFEDMEARYGSTMNFATQRLGLEPSTVARLRTLLLEEGDRH